MVQPSWLTRQPSRQQHDIAAPCCVCRQEGLAGLWKGVGPNIARNAIINAAELASYDQVACLCKSPECLHISVHWHAADASGN